MYEQKTKRRVKFIRWSKEAQQNDLEVIREFNELEKNKLPNDRLICPLEKTAGQRFYRGWFVGYGFDVVETENGIASYTVGIIENDESGIDLVNVERIEFIP